jgi:proline dehydrogenase
LLKGALLYLANRRPVYRLIMRHDLLRGLTQRYVAGEELADGVVVAQALNTQRLLVSLDHLGESVTNAAEADRAVSAYLEAIEALAQEEVEGNVSLKLTQVGLDLSRELCVTNLRKILDRARELDTFVRIDMESSAYTQRTLEVHQELWGAGYRNVGTVLQAYLYRTAADVQQVIEQGVPVRLCKGAYLEPHSVAFARKADVDRNFSELMRLLLDRGEYPAIATHDPKMIEATKAYVNQKKISRDAFEFQMLYGIRRDLQRQLIAEGYRLRLYVPFGKAWYPYYMRRLAERPANVLFIVRNLFRS